MPNSAPGYKAHPDHRVDLTREPGRMRIRLGDTVLADGADVVTMHESGYEPVRYFSRADVRMDLLQRTDHRTRCPFKGEASYWSLAVGDRTLPNVVWSYEMPYDEVADLRGRLAFWLDKMPDATIEQVA